MKDTITLHGYKKAEGVANIEVANFLAAHEIPFNQEHATVELSNERFNFERRVKVHTTAIAYISTHLRGFKQDSIGRKPIYFYSAVYNNPSRRVVREFADVTLIGRNGKIVEYEGAIMVMKPKELYERTIIVPCDADELKKASAQYHSLRSDFLRARALERLRFAPN